MKCSWSQKKINCWAQLQENSW